ncbi:unnamed protein product [Allacma fusca]|uniref:Uncharacterized protein n=1 Tax=Allacma fusca TaxID=39272 RepID=A0A8J2KUE8_9HEXA|nr:unnamed protein product [Allacma fusca]
MRNYGMRNKSSEQNISQPAGFEPARGDPIGLAVQRLNHSAKAASPHPTLTQALVLIMSGRQDTESRRPLKITVVGDGTVGKTCLLISYTANSFPTEHEPTVFDNYAKTLTVDGAEFSLTLWDTAGQEEYEKLRPLSYPKTDCFILCYAVDNRSSFANIESKWIGELRQHCPLAAVLLVGTKADLIAQGSNPVTEQEGKKLKSKIKAKGFLHCSAKTGDNIDNVFIESVRAAMNMKDKSKPSRCCSML